MEKKVFITGASGFIGSHVAAYFCNKEYEVICGIRKNSNISYLKSLPISLVHTDITDLSSLTKEIRNIDCVIHTAALVNDWGRYRDFYNINVKGTLNVLKTCLTNGIRKVIITGSNSSYGEEHSGSVKTEASGYKPRYPYFLDKIIPNRMNFYRISKALCTIEAIKFAESHNINLFILEPVWVYGEREFSSGFYEYMRTMKYKLPVFPGSYKNKFHAVYVKDLARAYYLASQAMITGIHRFIIGNREAEPMSKIYALICNEMGVKKPKNLPKFLVYPLGFTLEMLALLLHINKPPLLSRSRVNMFYDSISYSTDKAFDMLRFQAAYTLEEGIKNTVAWYKTNKFI